MNKAYYTSIVASVFCIIFSSSLCAMDEAPSLYADFEEIDTRQYIIRCMPKRPQDKTEEAEKVIDALILGKPMLIEEDDFLPENVGKAITEGGASFPLNLTTQGPFLEYCGSGSSLKRILDIGPGHGNDTIALLLTHNVQVIAVDIQQKQLLALKTRVNNLLQENFPHLLDQRHISYMKRNFAVEGSVPQQYLRAFEGANISRVLHFCDKKQADTMVKNVASMLKMDAMLSVVVCALTPGSREEGWYKQQEAEGLNNPSLVYYDIVTKRTKQNMRALKLGLPAPEKEWLLVKKDQAGLPGPGYKKETMNQAKGEHRLRQGRYYFTLEILRELLDPYFTILDSKITDFDAEDSFLSVIARKKSQ